MSDETAAAEATETTPEAAATPEAPAQETDWKAEARKWEARAKENSKAADRLSEIEEANKTEAQKVADRLAAAEAKVAEYEREKQTAAWRNEVAEATGVPVAALRGSTKEELEAHAEALKSLITPEKKGATGPYVPPKGDPTTPATDAPTTSLGMLRAAYAETER